jgi:hypothetical protein
LNVGIHGTGSASLAELRGVFALTNSTELMQIIANFVAITDLMRVHRKAGALQG